MYFTFYHVLLPPSTLFTIKNNELQRYLLRDFTGSDFILTMRLNVGSSIVFFRINDCLIGQLYQKYILLHGAQSFSGSEIHPNTSRNIPERPFLAMDESFSLSDIQRSVLTISQVTGVYLKCPFREIVGIYILLKFNSKRQKALSRTSKKMW